MNFRWGVFHNSFEMLWPPILVQENRNPFYRAHGKKAKEEQNRKKITKWTQNKTRKRFSYDWRVDASVGWNPKDRTLGWFPSSKQSLNRTVALKENFNYVCPRRRHFYFTPFWVCENNFNFLLASWIRWRGILVKKKPSSHVDQLAGVLCGPCAWWYTRRYDQLICNGRLWHQPRGFVCWKSRQMRNSKQKTFSGLEFMKACWCHVFRRYPFFAPGMVPPWVVSEKPQRTPHHCRQKSSRSPSAEKHPTWWWSTGIDHLSLLTRTEGTRNTLEHRRVAISGCLLGERWDSPRMPTQV